MYEEQILSGAPNTLDRIVGIQVELSLVSLYEGQMLFTEMLQRLEAKGFQLYRPFPAFIDFRSGRWLQSDTIFFRNGTG